MKKLLSLLFLLASASTGFAQTIVSVGSAGYVTVNGQNYARRLCSTYYGFTLAGDTTLQLYLPNYGYVSGQKYSSYLDGDNGNTPFASMAAIKVWMNAHLEPNADTINCGGGSGTMTSLTAGAGLSGGTITTSGTIALNGVLPAITSVNAFPAVGNGVPIIVVDVDTASFNPPSLDTIRAFSVGATGGKFEITGGLTTGASTTSYAFITISWTNAAGTALSTNIQGTFYNGNGYQSLTTSLGGNQDIFYKLWVLNLQANSTLYIIGNNGIAALAKCWLTVKRIK